MSRYSKTLWDTNTVYNPTNMNHIEQGIYDADLREGGTITNTLTIDRGNSGDSNIFLGGSNSNSGMRFYNSGYFVGFYPNTLTSNKYIALPDKTGTIALTSDVGYADDVKYMRGSQSLSSGLTNKQIITTAISNMNTENKFTIFDIVVYSSGARRFTGLLYGDKSYGSGIYHDTGGSLWFWSRWNNTDSYYSITKTSV